MNDTGKLRIAVLRGGTLGHASSISGGYGVLDSLSRMNVSAFDVYIDQDGIWYAKGVMIEPHTVFAQVDGYVDTTEDMPQMYKDLARRMGVKKLLWDYDDEYHQDRENIYRVLRQKGIYVPETKVIRILDAVNQGYLKNIWKSLHTPYLARPLVKNSASPSVFVDSFDKFKEASKSYAEKEVDFHVLTYRGAPTISTAVLPNYRGEDLYVPLSVTTLLDKRETPSDISKVIVYRSHEGEYTELKKLLTNVYETLLLREPALIDVVKTPRGFMVVEVQTRPSLKEHGRFMQSLKTTGVEIAQYILDSFPDLSKTKN